EETPAVRQRVNNGILRYIFVKNRGNFLVPPRELRALPTPDGEAPQ
ncbi:Tat pathway signal protein, partial [Halobacteriales archaeon QS_9_70_65]